MYSLFISIALIQIVVFCQEIIPEAHKNENATQILQDEPQHNDNLNVLQWKDINVTLAMNTSHQVIGYYPGGDRVYLIGGEGVENEYYSLQFNKTFEGWKQHKFEEDNLRIIEYQQSFFSSQHNIIYIKTDEYIHIYDMEIEYFNENVIRLPGHLTDGCMTVYYEPHDETIEYLIIIGAKTHEKNANLQEEEPTTYIYKVDQKTHNITWFDIGPDLVGERENFCCTVMGRYLYVIGGTYDEDTRFAEQWLIDIDTAYQENVDTDTDNTDIVESDAVEFDNFSNIDTLINTFVADYNLPQYGHRCIVNKEKQQIYVIGGVTEEEGLYFNYSRYVLVLERINDTLYEMNYRETQEEEEEEMESFDDIHSGKILPSLPMEMAYTSPMIDKYGYLNIFGGEISSDDAKGKGTNKWLRINVNNNGNNDGDEKDVIWTKHRRHNHNEQWAILILLVMIILVGLWFKCIERISKLRSINRSNGRGSYTDGTAYDEISGTSEIDELEEEDDIGDDEDDDDDDIGDENDNDNDDINAVNKSMLNRVPSSSDDNYSKLNGIIANHSEIENNAEVVV